VPGTFRCKLLGHAHSNIICTKETRTNGSASTETYGNHICPPLTRILVATRPIQQAILSEVKLNTVPQKPTQKCSGSPSGFYRILFNVLMRFNLLTPVQNTSRTNARFIFMLIVGPHHVKSIRLAYKKAITLSKVRVGAYYLSLATAVVCCLQAEVPVLRPGYG
jgi:hypothetical protein